jgi:hypothetical protein
LRFEGGRYVVQRKDRKGGWGDYAMFDNLRGLLDWLWVSGSRHPIFGERREDA